MPDVVEPFSLAVPQADLDDLADRLARTRWPEAETVDDWSQGVPRSYLDELCRYWSDGYDWRRLEATLNGFGQFRTDWTVWGSTSSTSRRPSPGPCPWS